MILTKVDMAAIVLIGLALIWQDASADTWLDIHIMSNHSEDTYTKRTYYRGIGGGYLVEEEVAYNEFNPGLGIEHEVTNYTSLGLGFFKHSYGDYTYYAGGDLHTDSNKPLRVGVSAAYAPGYKDTPADTVVTVLPNVVLKYGDYRVKIGHLPFGDVKVTTVTVGFKFR